MPPCREDCLKICEILAQEENLQVTITESLKAGLFTGLGALFGGLLGGPAGIAIGGSLAAVSSAFSSKGKFKSVVEVIMYDMTPRQRNELADSVNKALSGIDAQDVIVVLSILAKNTALKEVVLAELTGYLTRQMSLTLA